jgi:hypothetical protein
MIQSLRTAIQPLLESNDVPGRFVQDEKGNLSFGSRLSESSISDETAKDIFILLTIQRRNRKMQKQAKQHIAVDCME